MLKNFVARLQKEWTIITGAPAAFISVIVLVSLLVFFMAGRHYKEIIFSLTETQKTRIQAKEAQLNEYRERLLLLPGTERGLPGVRNNELKNMTFSFVKELRVFIQRNRQEERNVTDSLRDSLMKTESPDEKSMFLESHNETLSMFILKRNAEYDRRFKASSVILRDELLSRLPEGTKNERVFDGYEYPINPAGIEMVADDLERMAEMLI